jgi:hypothetical protein
VTCAEGAPPRPPRPPRPPPCGKRSRCCRLTGLYRLPTPARSPVGEWQVLHFPSPALYVERAAHGLVNLEVHELGDILDLGLGQVRSRRSLGGMPPPQEWPDLVGIAVVQNQYGADQIGAPVGAPGMRAVAIDALGGPHLAATVGGGGIHHVLVVRPHSARDDSLGGSPAGALCGGSAARRRLGAQHHPSGRERGEPRARSSPVTHPFVSLTTHRRQDEGAPCRANKRSLPYSFPASSDRRRGPCRAHRSPRTFRCLFETSRWLRLPFGIARSSGRSHRQGRYSR